MKVTTVHIDELRVRVSGLAPEQARHLGQVVAERLAKLPMVTGERFRRIGALNVRVHSGLGSATERMCDEIAATIRRSLG